MPPLNPDSWLEAKLRKVPQPAGMLERLRKIASGSSADLDAELCNVSVPEGLLVRLHQVPAYSDEHLDAELREVALPRGMMVRLGHVSQHHRRRLPQRQLALAASLLIAVGLSYFTAIAGFIISAYRVDSAEHQVVLTVYEINFNEEVKDTGPFTPAIPSKPEGFIPLDHRLSDLVASSFWEQQTSFEQINEPSPDLPPTNAQGPGYLGLTWPDLFAEVLILGGTPGPEELEPPEIISGPRDLGIMMPPVQGYPHIYELRWNVHPFVSPANEQLRVSHAPLISTTLSYDEARRSIFKGRLPKSRSVRVEEFLAALEYDRPMPERGPLALYSDAGPSLLLASDPTRFSRKDLQLIQFIVQAGLNPQRQRPPTHLVVALDVSGSMRWMDRMKITRRALEQLVKQMGPRDRISIVVYSKDAETLIEDAGKDRLEELQERLRLLDPSGSTNLVAGLWHARSIALSTQSPNRGGPNRRIVLLTDGPSGLSLEAADRIKSIVSQATTEGIKTNFIDLSGHEEVDPELRQFAAAGQGKVFKAANVEQLRWALLESLSGQSQQIVADAKFSVSFNPRNVEAYRLIGHEEGVSPGRIESDLRSGQTAIVLYEVLLKPKAKGWVARAQVKWRDPSTGKESRPLRQTVHRKQFAKTFISSSESLQAAAIVAKTAEAMRKPNFSGAKKNQVFREVLRLAQQMSPHVTNRPSFELFISMVRRALRAK